MKLEALTSFTYRWPGGEVHLEPGKPIDLPDERAQRLLNKAPEKVRVCPPIIQPGDRIEWERADLTVQHGVVDFLHADTDGTGWAFYTMPDGRCGAVNTKHVTKTEEGSSKT